MSEPGRPATPTTSHWGAFRVRAAPGGGIDVTAHPDDPAPSPLLGNVPGGLRHATRVARPAIRRGWLEDGPGPSDRRGGEPFVEVGWEEALDLLAAELARVRESAGHEAIFGGSYGWASAGRFHHAQSQLHRFLALFGGYTSSRNSYSIGTSEVLLPHLVGSAGAVLRGASSWPTIVANTELIVAFGGIPEKNVFVTPGGMTRHGTPGYLAALAARGTDIVLISPLRGDLPAYLDAQWHPVVPGTDVALMLGLAHTLVAEGLHDKGFLDRYCAGYDTFERYLLGEADGGPKDASWAGPVCGIEPEAIRQLARRMAAARTLVTVTWSLQRARHGEQPVWAALALAAMLGQIGLPGGGFGHGYGSMGDVGSENPVLRLPTLHQGHNPVRTFIPVARIADMLRGPGTAYDYDGRRYTYPDIRLVYWAGGNPFHHHQDLGRLRTAFGRPDTIVVHETHWTATARHADIVLPATMSLEREDIGAGRRDTHLIAMHRATEPPARPGTTTTSWPRWPGGSAWPRPSPRAGPRASGWSTSTASGARPCSAMATRSRASPSSGRSASSGYPEARRTSRCSRSSAPTRSGPRCGRRAGGSRSPRPPWPASGTTTVPGTRCGWSRTSGWAARGPAASRCT